MLFSCSSGGFKLKVLLISLGTVVPQLLEGFMKVESSLAIQIRMG
jgi:hypothetical protein